MTRTAALLVGLMSFAGWAADVQGQVRAWLGPGFDSNARRDFVSEGGRILPDGFLFGLAQAEGRVTFLDRLRLRGAYDVAGRVFLLVPSEDSVVQSAQLDASAAVFRWFGVGLLGGARDRRGAGRDYTDLTLGARVELVPADPVEVRLSLSAHRFIYWPSFGFSWYGPDALLSARYRFDRHHSLSVFGQYNPRTYNAVALHAPGPEGSLPPPDVPRADTVLGAGASWTYRGPFHLSVGYAYFDQTSNSVGETIRRHRLSITGAVPLPWSLTAFATGTLQLASYPEGIQLDSELRVLEDDDYASSVTVKVLRPLGAHVDLDLRYAFYFSQLVTNGFVYERHVVTLGVALSF